VDKKLYTAKQVAKWFQVSTKTVAAWQKKGVFPERVRTPGGHRRFKGADVLAELKKYGYAIPEELAGVEQGSEVNA
jgi:DNA-binding transcriptional MerR regulator